MSSSNYHGRRGPAVSQYIQGLNMVHDPTANDEPLDHHDDLSLFMDTTFIDETGNYHDYQALPLKIDGSAAATAATAVPVPATATATASSPTGNHINDAAAIGNLPIFDFNFPDFATTMDFPEGIQSIQAIQDLSTTQVPYIPMPDMSSQLNHHKGAPPAAKRKSPSESADDEADTPDQRAAEEDKRKRNTAASARFRVKKKLREQELEKSAKEFKEKVTTLENKIQKLETENKWLRGLVTDKNGDKDEIMDLLKNIDAAAWKKIETVRAKEEKAEE